MLGVLRSVGFGREKPFEFAAQMAIKRYADGTEER